jgi:mono/diheme cytochrome c family protein
VLDLHRAQLREPHDPDEGHEAVPWWLWAVAVALLFWSGFYLGRYSGSFNSSVRQVRFGTSPWSSAPALTADRKPAPVAGADGAAVFARTCAACHQPSGLGVTGVFPPLAGSEWVVGVDSVMVKIVLRGLTGPVQVKGNTYNGTMPAWASQLNDRDLAAVVTFVRSSWGNSAAPVDSATVARLRASTNNRASPWSVHDLR